MKTQENKNAFLRSVPIPMLNAMSEDSKVSRDLKPSPELFEMIQAAASSLTGFAQLWESIRKKGNSEGFNDEQLQRLLRPLLQNKLGMNRNQVYYLFHKEEIKEKQQRPLLNIQQIDEKKEPEQTDEEPTKEELEEIKRAQQPHQQPVADIPIKAENLYPEGQDFFTVMKKRADGVHSFYYDAYGIDLFRNRELAQLKNSGVKVFRRLYFEV